MTYVSADNINSKLAQFLREGQNWEKKATNIHFKYFY
jgi:hypothetical protein